MTAIDALENQLLEYWQQSETQKTWDQWKKWLDHMGLSLLSTGQKITSGEKINYQMFLSLCEEDLSHSPEWLKKLTDPAWLHEQNLVVLPGGLSQVRETELTVMRQQIAQLSRSLKQLQQQVAFLENRVSTSVSSPSPAAVPRPAEYSKSGLQKAQMMEKELIISQSAKKPKPRPSPEEQLPEIKPQPLEEIYLSFNQWVHQFLNSGIDLQQLASSPIQDESKRQISFGQFERRLEKKMDDWQQFQHLFQQFSDQHADGFIPDLPETTEEVSETSSGSTPENERLSFKPFELPPEDIYRGFNDWLEWLKEYGIDPHEFASQDLTVSSTRQISFQQFCRRLERNLEDIESFRNAIQIT